MFIEQQIII